jgi:exosortase B
MNAFRDLASSGVARSGRGWLPPGLDPVAGGLLLAAFLLMYLPSYAELARIVWPRDEQGHGPIILAVSIWLLWQKRVEVAALEPAPARLLGGAILGLGLLFFVFGRSQSILLVEVGSQIVVLCGLALLFLGKPALRAIWFPLFFLLFMTPLPENLVVYVTSPLKSAVSAVAADLLHRLGYPVGRAGVILNVGQYQLLVADACAGLNSMFTLEALGLLYMNLMRYTNAVRNVVLAVLIIPIAFAANIVRVVILVLVTYHFGDEAGQGFAHDFAGMVLFMVGLVLMLLADHALRLFFRSEKAQT